MTNFTERYPVLAGQLLVGDAASGISPADRKYVSGGQFSGMVIGSPSALFWIFAHGVIIATRVLLWMKSSTRLVSSSIAPFVVSVSVIVRFCAKKKMVRTDARRVITTMEDAQSIGNRTMGEFPRYTVSGKKSTPHPKSPIAYRPSATGPKPAVAITVDLRPESFRERWTCILIRHLNLHCSGVAPRSVGRTAGAFSCPNYITDGVVKGLVEAMPT